MIKYFKNAFKITNQNIILTVPLILCLLFLSIYLGFSRTTPNNPIAISLLILTVILILSAFLSGWLFMIKRAIDLSKKDFYIEDDKSKASFNLIKEFPSGIGEFFLSAFGGVIFYGILIGLFIAGMYFIGTHFIGNLPLSAEQIKLALASPDSAQKLLTTLSKSDLIKINEWDFLFLGTATLFSFLVMFWTPQIIYATKNPFKAFFIAIKNTFSKFLGSIVLFIYISALNFFVSLVNAFSVVNVIVYFFAMLLYFYFFVYIIVLIFYYYDGEFIENAGKTEGDSDSRSNCDGQDETCDKQSEED